MALARNKKKSKGVFFTAGLVTLALVVASLSIVTSQEKNENTRIVSGHVFLSQVLDEERDISQGVAEIFHQRTSVEIQTTQTGWRVSSGLDWPPPHYQEDVEWYLGLWNTTTGAITESPSSVLYPRICFFPGDPCWHATQGAIEAAPLNDTKKTEIVIETGDNNPQVQPSTTPGSMTLSLTVKANDTTLQESWDIDPLGENNIIVATREGSTFNITVSLGRLVVKGEPAERGNLTITTDTGTPGYRKPFMTDIATIRVEEQGLNGTVWAPL